MLYEEFAKATKCRDNPHNHDVYKAFELLYMTCDELTKEDVYKMAKKFLDNSKSDEELAIEQETRAKIGELEAYIVELKADIDYYKNDMAMLKSLVVKTDNDRWWIEECARKIRWRKSELKSCKEEIAKLKWVLG